MAIKWTEVTQKPEFQSLSPLEKHQAQEQYFEEQVVPQLSVEEAKPARNQFFTEFPTEFGKAIDEHVKNPNPVLAYNESVDVPKSIWDKTKDVVKDSAKMAFKANPLTEPLVGIAETGAAMLPSMAMEGAVGIAGISPQFVGAKMAYDKLQGKNTSPLQASSDIIAKGHELTAPVQEFLQPRTEMGKELTKGLSYPFELAHEMGENAQDYWEAKGHYKTGFVNKMLLEAAPFLIPYTPKILKEAKIRGTSPIKIIEEIKQNPEAITEVIPEPVKIAPEVTEIKPVETPIKEPSVEGFPEGFSVKKVSTGLVGEPFTGYEYEVVMPDGKTFGTASLESAKSFANKFKSLQAETKEIKPALEEAKPVQAETPKDIVQWTLDKGGINYTAERWKGELRDLRDTLNEGKKIGIGNRVIKSQGKYTLDQLALMAKDEGFINEATPQALLDSMRKGKLSVSGIESLPEPSPPKTEIDIAALKKGDKVFIDGEGYQHQGFDEKGNIILKDGLDYALDAFDKFKVDADKKGNPVIQRTAKTKPVQQDMIGVPKDALSHPLLSREMGETLLEKMVEESKTREVQKQDLKKQGKFDFLSVEPYSEPIGEAGYIKMGKSKDIPDVDIKKVVSKDINPLEQGLTTLHVADRHPFMKPAIETAIKATQDTHHATTQSLEKLTKIFDEAEGKPLFGLIKRRSSALRDIDLMREGKKETPASLKNFVENIKDFLGEERQRVIGNQKQEILSKATESQKKYLKYLSEGGEEPQVKDVVKQAAYELKAALLEADKWGQTDYFPRSMAGDYYYLGSDGKLLGIGKTPKQAKLNLMERLESNPELKGSTVYFVNGLKAMLSTRHTLNPELRGTLEQLGASLPRKKFFGLLNKIENMVDAEISEAGVGDVKGVNVDLKGIAKMQSNKKFAGNLLKRHTEMRGQEADPFKTLSTYTAAVERNLGLSNAKKYLINFEESLPPHMENAKTYIRKLRENMLGYYDWGNKLVDQTIGKKIGAKPYLLSRTLQKGQSLTANLTLGYAPVKSLLNYVDATLSTVTKTGARHWGNGVKMLFTKEGKELINEIGHLAGLEESFAYSHKVGAQKPNLIKPMGLYQFAELKGRTQSLAAAYSQGLEIFKGDKIKAKDHAVNIARLTQGLYDVAARPIAVRGAALSTAYQFKQFINNKIRFLDSLTPAQMSFYIPSIISLYGTRGIWLTLKSIIGITLISDVLGNIGEKTNEELNKKHPQLHRGLFGLVGIDVSAAGTVQLPTQFRDWAGKFYVDTFKAGDMMVKGLKNNGWTDEEIADYINSVAPVGYNIYKGLQMATKGEIREGQKLMYKGSPYEAIANLSGAKTVQQSQAQDTIRYENLMKQRQNEKMPIVKKNLLSSKTQDEWKENLSEAIKLKGISTDKELEDFGKGLLNEMIKNNLTARQRVFMTLPKNLKRSEIREYQK